jgi:hypothetical protein
VSPGLWGRPLKEIEDLRKELKEKERILRKNLNEISERILLTEF